MRWPWRRRGGDGGRVVFIGTSPFDVVAAINAVPTPSPVVAAWVPDAPPVSAAPATPPAQAPLTGPAAHVARHAAPAAPAAAPPAPGAPAAGPPAGPPAAPPPPAAPVAAPPAPAAPSAPPAHTAAAAPRAAAPAPAPAPPAPPGVQLGFADGTVMTLADDDPRAVALRAAAARLTSTS